MFELYYTPIDIATILYNMNLGIKEESIMLDKIWKEDGRFFMYDYKTNQRRLILDVMYHMHYFEDKPILDKEFPYIQQDLIDVNKCLYEEDFISENVNIDLFFKNMRIQILYGGGNDYSKIKLRNLLKQYGYKKRNPKLVEHIKRCIKFYNLDVTLKGGEKCDIETVPLDEVLIFRAMF